MIQSGRGPTGAGRYSAGRRTAGRSVDTGTGCRYNMHYEKINFDDGRATGRDNR